MTSDRPEMDDAVKALMEAERANERESRRNEERDDEQAAAGLKEAIEQVRDSDAEAPSSHPEAAPPPP